MAKKITALKTIRLKCLDCSGGSPAEVRHCTAVNCSLWEYRFGKNPRTILKKRPELLDKQHMLSKNRDIDL